ncbi:MAG: hypothetical protein KKG09_07405 [Verrucomicrobia bacterium]|nr:hypothetical protein [Verrucomicrobiota bacterium]MBU4290872.1 hypothetical protein [Verrucomicrobiota bacterium]MBU4429695.1 hypothetical protein [Verrucomicrobiota bacterium]MBU4497812.1 hypothetical protein [Verrucomicrobiota bacterium]MCG2680621.1 hypothetical protein [Kiritimatiellia bacterium]
MNSYLLAVSENNDQSWNMLEKGNSFALFRDTVTEQAVVDMVTKKSRELGATKTTDLVSRTDSTGLQTLFTIWYYSVQVSGNAVK